MLMSYLGALKSIVYGPIVRNLGVGLYALRIPMLLAGTAASGCFFCCSGESQATAPRSSDVRCWPAIDTIQAASAMTRAREAAPKTSPDVERTGTVAGRGGGTGSSAAGGGEGRGGFGSSTYCTLTMTLPTRSAW